MTVMVTCRDGRVDKYMRFGDEFVNAYSKLKTQEWNNFARHLTQWERDNTLDC